MVFYRKCPVEICLVKPSPRFGSEQLITFVAMATPDDLNANAEFIRLADSFVEVPGADPLRLMRWTGFGELFLFSEIWMHILNYFC